MSELPLQETLGRVAESGLPALLLQCLYLFFVFPLEKDELLESDVQVQRMFVQMLLNICGEAQGLEGLLSGNELQSLMIATTCLREHSCYFWKEPTFCVLKTISKAQNVGVIQYLQAMDCIKISLQNLSRLVDTLPAPEVSEVVSLVLGFVKDSYPISSALFLEFETGEGYPLLLKVLLRYDGLTQSEVDPHLEELLGLVVWLTTCGRSELKVFDSITYPQLEGFKFHHEASGVTVKNLQAFQVLQNVFHKVSDPILCTKVLSSIRTMWTWNARNFFLLEWTLQPISQFVEIVPLKPTLVQRHFFQMLEALVFELRYVPHEILRKVQRLIQESPESLCTLVALQSILRIAGGDPLFTDIFRDSGFLGLLLAQLRKQAKILRKSGNKEFNPGVQDTERELTCVMLKTVVTLLKGSVRNAVVLKDHGMVPFIKIFLDDECYRGASLSILEQLSVINAEEYMSITVGALCSSTQGEIQLKLDLLKSLLRILETPKGRAAFRVSSGFNGLLSLLSDLEGSLQEPPLQTWGAVSPSQTLDLVLHTLCALSAALYLDPVNGDFFRRTGLFEKLAEDLCLLGCFGALEEEDAPPPSWEDTKARPFADLLSAAFSSASLLPPKIQSCLQILSFLDSMARGTLHLRRDLKDAPKTRQELVVDPQRGEPGCDPQGNFKQWPAPEESRTDDSDAVIMHPGVLCIMVRLLPRLYHEDHPQLSREIQCSMASHIQSLVKSEKNRQVMCEAGMLRTLMTSCHKALTTSSSPLHSGLIRIFEKLASQAIEPDVLRQFLGLGIASPPSAAMKKLSSSHVHGGDSGCPGAARSFPPPGGLTFSCWFLIGRHSAATEGHPLRFLTLVRHLARTEQPFICFSVSLCPEDFSLVVSTEEKEFQPLDVMEPEDDPEPSAGRQLRVRCGQLLACGQWHHLAVVVTKEMKRNCTVFTYLDGQVISSAKMLYIQALPGPFLSMDPSSFVDVYGYIATPRVWKQKSLLIWRLGPTYFFEEAISMETLEVINKLGPRYCGNFQAVHVQGVRVFHSSPAASSLDFIGGPAILLGLISLATDDHSMYAAVKVLHLVLTSNVMCDRLMQHICGYQIMAFLLRKKTSFLNHRIFQLILSITGTAELGFGSSVITNVGVFQHVLCNFELWMNAADNLELSLFSHLVEILQSTREGPRNAEVAHQAQLIPKLVFLFNEPGLTPSKMSTIIAILGCQLRGHFSLQDLLRIGLFVVYTLKPSSVNEKQICVDGAQDPSLPAGSQTSGKTIWLRNQLLEMLLGVISSSQLHLSSEIKEEMFLNLGSDWFLLFVQGHVHPSTVVLGLKLLLHFLSSPSLRGRFKDGLPAGSWVERSSEGMDIMMDNLKSHPAMPDQSPCLLPGFRVLSDFLARHVHIPEVYLIVSTFFLQTPLTELVDGPKDSLDAMLQWLLHKHHTEEVLRAGLCTEGALLLLEMLKATMNQASPDNATSQQKRDFQSEILLSTMEIFHLMSGGHASMLRGSREPQPNAEAAAAPSLANISHFIQKLVEKLYSGMFSADPRHILLFITEHIMVVIENASSQKDTVINALYSSLNKVILYSLSKPHQSLSECLSLLSILDFLQEHWDIVFATYNSNASFLMCLMHCLLLLSARSYPEGFGLEPKPRMTPYHQVFLSPNEETREKRGEEFPSLSDASEKKSLASRSNVGHHGKVSSWSGSLSSAMRLMPGRQTKDPECKAERRRCGHIKAANAWARIQEQLFGELGLWYQMAEATPCSQWELDWREGPARMRKRIRRLSPLEAPNQEMLKESQNRNGSVSQINTENQDELTLKEVESERDEVVDCTQLTFFPALRESLHSEDFLELCLERQVILQELLDHEKVTQKYSLVIVQGHLVCEGLLLFGQQHFYVCENFTLSPVGDVYCTRHCLSNISDPFIFNMCSKDRSSDHYSCQRHSYGDLRELRQARFLLQDIALEIFFQNGYSKFLVFHNSDRSKVFKSFCSFQPSLKGKGFTEDTLSLRRYPSSDKTMLQKWQKRDISNFEYLMYLNTLAGRTYNDYMQYPVFPWVLADYTSQTLNLMNPKTFRDLSKPMGAQTKERKLKFIQRFKEVEKTEGDMTVQCHYCTHYSSAIIVASYLVRMPPFTQAFCSLQGGSFDVADRMFHSVKNAWESASRENMSDVRELTPEFFYLPEFLTNCNALEFGCMQDGTTLGDVQLPPWADGDPRKFISLHRQALESDFVSANLHHWIDLIFGYKQQGSAAVEAVNTFHPYFYGDKMDLSSISDPLIRSTILGFVSNFGQVPKQLFTKPHPARTAAGKPSPGKDVSTPASLPGHPQPFFYSLQSLRPSQVTVKGSESPKGAIGHIVPTEKTILAVETNKMLLPPHWSRTFSWGFDDFSCCLGNYGSDKASGILVTFENLAAWGRCLCAVCPSPTTIITSGTSAVVCVWELSMTKGRATGLRLKQALYGHTQAVTCLAASVTFNVLVSGSQDCMCILWDLDHLTHVARLPAHREGVSAVAISDVSGTIVSCAGAHLSLWDVNGQPLASITTAWGPEGAITCCYVVEGPAWDTSHVIITGSQDGMVRIWKTEDVKMSVPGQAAPEEPWAPSSPSPRVHRWEKNLALCRELDVSVALTGKPSKANSAVTALAVSRNQTKLLVGDEKGRIFCWSAEG
ncbi:hypothetical protein G4228_011069 [Cervus hanglu yarkandensis]|nr:hypothetical protein G4228_011069 [Cervus hanglu yarkandensis]